jgi:hypothetical protein
MPDQTTPPPYTERVTDLGVFRLYQNGDIEILIGDKWVNLKDIKPEGNQ